MSAKTTWARESGGFGAVGRRGSVMKSGQGRGCQITWRRWLGLWRPTWLRGLLAAHLMFTAALVVSGLWPMAHVYAQSEGAWQNESSGAVRHIVVTLHKSRTLRLDKPFSSAVVGSTDIVDALPMSDRALYIQGKRVGTTNISVFDQGMRMVGLIDVEVAVDTGNLQEKIRSSTGSGGIRVASSNGQIVLGGVAGNAAAADRALQVAKSMVPEGGSVVNAMRVAEAQQVMLKVRFLEVGREASREIGVNWFGANNAGNRGFRTGVGATIQPGGRPAVTGVDASGNPIPPPNAPAGSGAIGLPIFTTAG